MLNRLENSKTTVSRITRSLALFCLGFCLSTAAQAKTLMNIVIDGGQLGGLPIAVVPFSTDDRGGSSVLEIANVVRDDLQTSGQFQVTPMAKLRQFPDSEQTVDYGYWRQLGAESLLLGRVQKEDGRGQQYTVYFQLLDVFKAVDRKLPLLSMRFEHIKPEDFRHLGHHIADLVFEKLIGVRGVFSTRIAYVSVKRAEKETWHHLEVADADGYQPKTLFRSSFPLMSPAWAPDGRRIAFVSFQNNRSQINIADVVTGRVEQVSQYPGINGAPAWSPDGKQLALVLSKEGNPKIYRLDVASKQLQLITSGTGIDTEPCWTPDSRSIVFTSNRGGKPQIYQVDLASKKISRITFDGVYNARPTLTPDGKRLVMMHQREAGGPFGIAVQHLESGQVTVLTRATLDDSPSIAPNGMMVMYGSQRGDRSVLGAVSLDGRIKLQLPAQEGQVQEPAWSPFLS